MGSPKSPRTEVDAASHRFAASGRAQAAIQRPRWERCAGAAARPADAGDAKQARRIRAMARLDRPSRRSAAQARAIARR
ncbi:MAG: hypothetical protein WBE85_13150, partial [Methylocella sp.]